MKFAPTLVIIASLFCIAAACIAFGNNRKAWKHYSPLDNHIEYVNKEHNANCQYEQGECPVELCSHHDKVN